MQTIIKLSTKFLAGGGEMGKLTRSFNWANTSVGSPDQWPQSLRTTVSIILNSRFPMFLWWGPDLIQFYNDAYRPSLGNRGKHPTALGQMGEDCWPEIWPIIKPLIDQVLEEGEATWSEDQLVPIYRNGRLEDVYWTFGYSPVHDESGKVGGVLVICTETTEKVQTLNQISETKEQYRFAIDAAKLATWDLNPVTKKLTGNNRLKEWFGLLPNDEIDLEYALAAIVDKDRQRVATDIQTALQPASGGHYDIEYTIIHPQSKKERLVRARGRALFTGEHTVHRFNGTMQDITKEVAARQALIESEKNFRNLFRHAPVAICVLQGSDYVVELANELMLELWGKTCEQVMNQPVFIGLPEATEQGLQQLLDNVFTTGKPYIGNEFPVELLRKGKLETVYINFVYEAYRDAAGTILGIIAVATEVTGQVVARKKIEASENELHQLADSLPQVVWTARPDGFVDYYNKQWYEYTGLDEAYGDQSWIPILHPDDVQHCIDTWYNSVKTGKEYQIQYRFIDRRTGGYRWFLGKALPIKDDAGKIIKWFGTCTDINEQKLAEESLKMQAQVLASMDEGVSISDERGFILHTNPAEDRMFGYEAGELTGKHVTIQNAYPTQENQRVVQQVIEQLTTKGYWSGEWHNQKKDGTSFFTHSHITAIDVGSKKLLVCVQRDITKEKRSREELNLSLERFRLMSDTMAQFVWTGDAQGNLNYFNQAVFNYSGLTMEQIGKAGWLEIVHPDDREENVRRWTHSVQTGQDFIFQHRFRKQDGEYRWQLSRALPQRDSSGNIHLWVGTSTDIHDQKLFEEELERKVEERTEDLKNANRQLERSNAELEQFAYVASHDLQEPLRKIKTFGGMLADSKTSLTEKDKSFIDKIISSSERMSVLIRDILNYSKLSKAGQQFIPTDLNNILDNVIEDFEVEINYKNASFKIDGLPVIDAIPLQMNQLFFNLIGNSLKFSKQNEPPDIDISASLLSKEEKEKHPHLEPDVVYYKILFCDNGIGFDPQYKEKIFTIFQRLNDRSYDGSGIGLALCRRIINNHCGEIYAQSNENEGAQFYIILPVKQKEHQQMNIS